MHKIALLAFFIMMLSFSGCQFNQSIETDLNTGAYARGNGIGVDDISIMYDDDVLTNTKFIYGQKINFVFNDVQGFTKVDGKTFPEMSIYVIENEQDTIISNPSLLEHVKNGTALSPLQLSAILNITMLPDEGKSYQAIINIWDRQGDGTFTYEVPFTVEESKLLDIDSRGIDYSAIYLWNDTKKKVVFDNNIDIKDTYILIIEGADGLTLNKDKVYPMLSLNLDDSNGNIILSEDNMFSAYESIGADPEPVKEQITATITFTEGNVFNPCKLLAILKDKYSKKRIKITSTLKINN